MQPPERRDNPTSGPPSPGVAPGFREEDTQEEFSPEAPEMPSEDVEENPEGDMGEKDPEDILKPRAPEPSMDMGDPMEGGVPTDIQVDAATGEITLNKGNTSLKIADFTGPEGEYAEWMRGNPPQMSEGNPIDVDTHDSPYAAAKNRLKPPQYDLIATIPEDKDPRSVAYALQRDSAYQTEINGNSVTVKDVSNILGLMSQLEYSGIDCHVEGENLPELFRGMKVAITNDIPKYGYYTGRSKPVSGVLLAKDNNKFLIKTPEWGREYFDREDFQRV